MTSQFANAKVGILGLGLSGQASLDVLASLGARCTGYDANPETVASAQSALGPAATLIQDDSPANLAARALADNNDLYIVSPGIPPHAPLFAELTKAGKKVISEVELAWLIQQEGPRPECAWLCVTGTNGKTTTVKLAAQMLITGGAVATAVGNVGDPIVTVAAHGAADALAVELSSFQLYSTFTMRPRASVCLNLAPDHIDWHGSFQGYRDAKAKVYAHTQTACLYPVVEDACRQMVEEADVQEGARAIGLTLGRPDVSQLGIAEGKLVDRAFLDERATQMLELASLEDLSHLTGGAAPTQALLTDVLAAAGLVRAYGLKPEWVRRGIQEFEMASHRRAHVECPAYPEVEWIDDSKATNAHAAEASLRPLKPGRAIWIAGGDAKGQDFTDLVSKISDRLKAVVLIGVEREPWKALLAKYAPEVPVEEVTATEGIMRAAVAAAARYAAPGDAVVLAPACASWDQFKSYAQRGDDFATAARELRK